MTGYLLNAGLSYPKSQTEECLVTDSSVIGNRSRPMTNESELKSRYRGFESRLVLVASSFWYDWLTSCGLPILNAICGSGKKLINWKSNSIKLISHPERNNENNSELKHRVLTSWYKTCLLRKFNACQLFLMNNSLRNKDCNWS